MTSPATQLIYLPVAAAGNVTWGTPDLQQHWGANVTCHFWPSEVQVWYNLQIRQQIIEYIDGLVSPPSAVPDRVILVGFSKSGLGALNLAPMLKDRLAGVVIFDVPVSMALRDDWGIGPYYPDNTSWQAELPVNCIDTYASVFSKDCPLILISGSAFHGQMAEFSSSLNNANVYHQFIPCPDMKHNWRSGWLTMAQKALNLPA